MLPLPPNKLVEEIARRALTDEAAKWFSRLVWSTRLVVFGVVIEGIPVVHEFVEAVKLWLRRRRDFADLDAVREIFPTSATTIGEVSESHTPTWVKMVALVGLICVAVGVAGEWIYEVKFEAATNAIQAFDNNRLTEAQRQVGDAATSAKITHDEAAAAKKDADDAISKSSQALQQVGTLDRQLVTDRAQLVELEKKRKELETSIAELIEKIRFRHVSPEQAEKIRARLLLSPPGSVGIEILPNAEDGDIYCQELAGAIRNGGWTSGDCGLKTFLYPGLHDLVLVIRDPRHPPPRAEILAEALESAKITPIGANDARLGDDDVILLIGPKTR